MLKKQNFDMFHPTYYNPYFLKNLGKKPFILDIHDMIHEIFRSYIPPKIRYTNIRCGLSKKRMQLLPFLNIQNRIS
jgi:hypothetical protein